MELNKSELKAGKKLRKSFYKEGKKHYAEIQILKVYPYKVAHSRDLRKKHTKSD